VRRRPGARLCSNACKGISQRNSATIICETCEAPFDVQIYRVGEARFCSAPCRREGLKVVVTDEEIARRFWANVDKRGADECWPWKQRVAGPGYGILRIGRSWVETAHRISWRLHFGDIPDLPAAGHHGTCVLHRCDNRACCNPGHLFIGTQGDNVDDMLAKGRHWSQKAA
jgi:hypothetical protein